jgi:hypothetical protein
MKMMKKMAKKVTKKAVKKAAKKKSSKSSAGQNKSSKTLQQVNENKPPMGFDGMPQGTATAGKPDVKKIVQDIFKGR